MATATCWNCGAGLSGPKCQWCGAAQTPEASQGPSSYGASAPQAPASYYGPGASAGQPADWQNQQTIASQPSGWQAPPTIPGQMSGWQAQPSQGYQQSLPGQPGNWSAQPPQGYQQPMPGQPGTWQAQQAAPGQISGWQGAPPPQGYQQPMPGQRQPARPAPATTAALGVTLLQGLPLGLAGGAVGGIIGAVIWAAFLNATNLNISYIAIGIGILVGFGAALGARGRVTMPLVVLTGVLGLFAFFLALYFRVSYWEGYGFSGLPLGDFSSDMGDYLQTNPLNYLYFALVPLAAASTAYRLARRRR